MQDLISRQAAIDAMNAKLEDIKLRWRRKVKKGEIAMYLDMRGTIETMPSAEPEELIRCKDCKHRDPEDKKCDCGHSIRWNLPRSDEWFCADAERRGEGWKK